MTDHENGRDLRAWRRWAWALAVLAALLHASAVAAAGNGRTVVLLRSSSSDDVTTEATARVEGELAAAGFHVEVVAPTGEDARHELETAGDDAWHAIAAFAIVVHPSGGHSVAEIWVSDRMKQTTVVARAELSGTNHTRESEILAVRAVELLRASLAELWAAPEAPSSPPKVEEAAPHPGHAGGIPPAPPVSPSAESARPALRSAFAGIGLGVGAGVLAGFEGVDANWAPLLLLSYGWRSGFALQLDLHALGTTAVVSAPAGTARVDEQFGTLDALKTWWPGWPVVPFVCGGVGVEHVHVSGQAAAPYVGVTLDPWSVFTSAGLGAAVPVYAGISIVARGRVAVAWPPTEVRIAEVDAGRVEGPSLLIDAQVLAVFR